MERLRPPHPSSCAIAVMAKASNSGRAKTRLAPLLTAEGAATLNTSFLKDIADNLLAASTLANIRGVMAYAPAGSADFFRAIMPDAIDLMETVAPDFGACLFLAASRLLQAGHDAVCLLNSDSPTLPTAYLVTAATLLAVPGDRIVLGPSVDGGFYLLGLKAAHRRLFEDIAWSTEHVARQTLERAADIGLAVHMLPAWYDVDDAVGLQVLAQEVLQGMPYRACGSNPTTAHWSRLELARLFAEADLDARLSAQARLSCVA
jgi:rSAM/selenodomain-associated transferase 1